MCTTLSKKYFQSFLATICVVFFVSASTQAAIVTTDAADYPPGGTVWITGSDFVPEESVSVQVQHLDSTITGGEGHEQWMVVASDVGGFVTSWVVPLDDNLGQTLKVTATGQTSGLIATMMFTDAPAAGTAPVNPPTGGFGIDGDLGANTPTSGIGDWVPGSSGSGGNVLNAAGVPIVSGTTFNLIDLYNSGSDNNFAGGLKFNDNPNVWTWVSNPVNAKQDINHGLIHFSTDPSNGHTWVMVAADRLSNNGDAYIDFEFLQNSLTLTGGPTSGGFSSSGPNGGRTVNDFVLTLELTNGGKVAGFGFSRWEVVGGGFDYVDRTSSVPASAIFAATNAAVIPVSFGAFGGTTYDKNQFVESGIDLTALLGAIDKCTSLGVKTILVKTKESQSPTATIVDFISPLSAERRIGLADAGPDQHKCTNTFTVTGIATPAPGDAITSTTWSVVSGAATITSPSSLSTSVTVTSSPATLRFTVHTSFGCVATDDVVLTVDPTPTCNISNDGPFCPSTTNQHCGPVGMDSYSWSISGNGSISGSTTGQCVNVLAGNNCNASYTLNLTVTKNNCSATCSKDILVVDNVPPVLSGCPQNASFSCYSLVPVLATVTATDNCGGSITPVFGEVQSNPTNPNCNNTITRTWTATDACNNVATCTQIITVNDNIPPTMDCPANAQLRCGLSPAPGNTGQSTAFDNCDNDVTITYSDVQLAPGCAGAPGLSRTWTATDDCGNSASCTQTIAFIDQTPPVLSGCPQDNPSFQCYSQVPPPATVTATDDCGGQIVVIFSEVQSNPTNPSCNNIITRTWTATDACNNTVSCSQTITVNDDAPPEIACPGPVNVQCAGDVPQPDISLVTASDNCPGLVAVTWQGDVISAQECANRYVITRTYRATDVCGNYSECQQIITVYDNTPPVLTACPNPIAVCEGSPISFTPPTANDACQGPVPVTCTRSDGKPLSDPYPIGTTTITCVAIDDCGNRAACSFTVTVNPNPTCAIEGGPGFGSPICAGSLVPINDLFCGPVGMASYSWSVNCGTIYGPSNVQCVSWIPPADGSICTFRLVVVNSNGCTSTCTRDLSVPARTTCAPQPPPNPLPNCGSTGNSYCIGSSLTITHVNVSCADWQVTGWSNNCFTYNTGSSTGPCTFIIDANNGNGCPVSCEVSFGCIPQQVFCTFTIGGWGSGCPASQAGNPLSTQPGCIRDHFFSSVFPSGVRIGHPSGYSALWTTSAAVDAFLPNGGTPGVLKQNYVNPTSTTAGVLASQILGLTFNVRYSCAGVFATLGISSPGFCYGSYVITSDCGTKFAGITVDSFLVLANKVVSGQSITFRGSTLKPGPINETATCLNEKFDACDPFAALGRSVAAKYSWMQTASSSDEESSQESQLPKQFGLNQNYPNPFNPVTEISYALPKATHVTIEVFNIMGQRVTALVDENKEAGEHSVTWNGSDVASGVYFYRLTTPEFVMTKKMLLMK